MQLLQTIKKHFSSDVARENKFTTPLLFILIALIPFSVRNVFDSAWNFKTGAYSDFTSLSLYMSDIVLVALLLCFMWNYISSSKLPRFSDLPRPLKIWLSFASATVAWLVLELFLQSRETLSLQTYFSLRIVLLIAFAIVISKIHVSREKVAWLFTILGGIQSIIAVFQFYWQKSLGLYILGESHLNPETLGVAKIVSHGTKMIRAYGTFPHANLLSSFLVCATLLNLYLLIKKPQISRGIWVYLLLILNIFGLFLTFSRGGILALGIGLLIVFAYFLKNRQFHVVKSAILTVSIAMVASIAILAPYLSTRTTITDNATKERLFYNQIGKSIIENNRFFGVGPGTSVLHMKQYSSSELEPWEIQPIHNYYLISIAEWGIGAILLLATLTYPIILLFKRKISEWGVILGAIAVSFLALFLFDHYFYTIWPTQLLLWLIIGLIMRGVLTYDRISRS